jgi:hypothetical protein
MNSFACSSSDSMLLTERFCTRCNILTAYDPASCRFCTTVWR